MENAQNESEVKNHWKKNLDNKYISGEDLINGQKLGKGLQKSMVVRLAKAKDVEVFDKSLQSSIVKTGLELVDHVTGVLLYKPLVMNKTNGEFLLKEIGNGKESMDEWDHTKPFVIYAAPDKRHGYVARLKSYRESIKADIPAILAKIAATKTEDELKTLFLSLSTSEQTPEVVAAKDARKAILNAPATR